MQTRRQKSRDLHRHALKRAWDRFGLRERDVERVVEMIRHGETTVVEKQSNRVSIHRAVYGDHTMHVAYDRQRKSAITFLYPEGNPFDYSREMTT